MYVRKWSFLYTCMQNLRLRTVYRQRKWPLPAPVRKIMTLVRKIMALVLKIMALRCKIITLGCNSTLRYECDETFSDECEFAARAEGEWCNHTCQENVFRTSILRNFISRGVKMRISAREACVRLHFHTRSEIKYFTRA